MFALSNLVRKSVCQVGNHRAIQMYEKWALRNSYLLQKNVICLHRITKAYSTDKNEKSEITKSESNSGEVSTTFKTVKETTKTASYTGVILIGVGVTGILFYAIFRELFSSQSPNSVYSKALDRCIKDQRIQDALGEPIKGFGEETRRGRRRHVSHLLYEKDGVNYLRMKFYIQGIRRKATVHLEMKENDKGNYEYRYLFVQLDDYPNTTFIMEDNRLDSTPALIPAWN